jgi:LytS/YehU family sensor histidine kinase
MSVDAALTVWLRPFYPLPPASFRGAFLGGLTSHFVIDALLFGFLLIGGNAYEGNRRTRRLDLRESRLEAELARAQLDALRLEIQPHFLFNTLNSISALIRLKDQDGALKMLLGLSDLRTAVERPATRRTVGRDRVRQTLRDLQRVRFADRLQVHYEIAEAATVAVPTFLLQPLVENALRHGASPRSNVPRAHRRVHRGRTAPVMATDDGVGLRRGFDLARDVLG